MGPAQRADQNPRFPKKGPKMSKKGMSLWTHGSERITGSERIGTLEFQNKVPKITKKEWAQRNERIRIHDFPKKGPKCQNGMEKDTSPVRISRSSTPRANRRIS